MVSRQTIEHSVVMTILALIAVGAFLILRPFLSAIIWAAVLTYSTWPFFERLKARVGGRTTLTAAIMILAIACALMLPIAVLSWSMADEVVRFSATMRGWLDHGLPGLPSWVTDIPLFGGRLMQRWHDLFQTGDIAQNLAPYVATFRAYLLAVASTVTNALLELFLSLILTFVFYCRGPEIAAAVEALGVGLTGERGRRLVGVVTSTVRSVVKGLLGTNLLQATLGALGFWVAGVPGAILLGFFVFFLTVVPFGAGLVWIPAAIWIGNTAGLGVAIGLSVWCVLIFGVLENVARPFLMGRGSTLPPLLILLGMVGGMSAFGFLGVFLGPALLALVYMLIDEWRAAPISHTDAL
jgi:predicted PurR-regulated permease PerM